MKRKKINICFALVLSVLAGCSSEERVIDDVIKAEKQKDVEVINGTLHFKDAESFMRISTEMANMDEGKRLEWENKNGFKSLNRSLTELMKTYDYDESVANLYPNYFEYTDSMLSISVPQSYNVVANSNGVFYVQDVIHKVNKDGVAYVINGSEKDVSEIVDGTRTCSAGESDVVRFDGIEIGSNKAQIVYGKENVKYFAFAANDGHKCSLNVLFYIKSVRENNQTLYGYEANIEVKNQKRKPHTYREHHVYCWYNLDELEYMYPTYDGIYYKSKIYYGPYCGNSSSEVVYYSKTLSLRGDSYLLLSKKPQTPQVVKLVIRASNNELSGFEALIDHPENTMGN